MLSRTFDGTSCQIATQLGGALIESWEIQEVDWKIELSHSHSSTCQTATQLGAFIESWETQEVDWKSELSLSRSSTCSLCRKCGESILELSSQNHWDLIMLTVKYIKSAVGNYVIYKDKGLLR